MLAVYRVGVPSRPPGSTGRRWRSFSQVRNSVLGLVNLFSGGALEQFSIFALGIMPYISASIILQLLTVVVPHLERLSKEGEAGRRRLPSTRATAPSFSSVIQGFGIAVGLENDDQPRRGHVVLHPGWRSELSR